MKYTDPANKEEILKSLTTARNFGQILGIIRATFPGWLLNYAHSYSSDYDFLNKNWEKVCQEAKCHKLKVLVVDQTADFKNSDQSVLRAFSELLTCFGCSVKSKDEIQLCKKCVKAIPTLQVYNMFKGKENDLPSEWSETCKKCNPLNINGALFLEKKR